MGALVALAIALTVALTGHAADWGDVSVAVGIDWLHLIAAMTWTGGLLILVAVVLRHAARWPSRLLVEVMRRLSRHAAWCLLTVVLTGAYNTWLQVPTVAALWQTAYGRALATKLLLVAGLVWWGAVNRYAILPRLGAGRAAGILERVVFPEWARIGSSRTAHPALLSRLAAYVAREAILAILVFGCTAVLVESPPARHVRHLEHHAGAREAASVVMPGTPR
jgi:putative copper export protein